MLPAYRKVIIEKLKRTGQMPDIKSRIVFERMLTPQDINDRYVLPMRAQGKRRSLSQLSALNPQT